MFIFSDDEKCIKSVEKMKKRDGKKVEKSRIE
jgi:hypothetical protein